MSDVSADLRIFPDKEMFSVDMAEVLDAAILKDGIIQGCAISITNGELNITAGRIVVSGRLGVITAGTIPIPTLSSQQTCSVVAVCDLRTNENPFYVSIVDANGLQTLNSAKSSGDGFNVEGTLNYVVLGTVVVNPTTGLVSNWTPNANTATAHKGKNVYQELLAKFTEVNNTITSLRNSLFWTRMSNDYKGQTWVTIPATAREVFVSVFVKWDVNQKAAIDFYLPRNGYAFDTTSKMYTHANYWGKDYNGFCRIQVRIYNGNYQVRLYECYNGETSVTANTYFNVYYR